MSKLNERKIIEWDLTRLYASLDDETIFEDIKTVLREKDELVRDYRGRISGENISARELRGLLEKSESLLNRAGKLSMFAYLNHSVLTADSATQKLVRKMDDLEAALESGLMFIKLELARVSDDFFSELNECDELKNYRHYFDLVRALRDHQLSEPEEDIIVRKDITGKMAMLNLFDEFTSTFEYRIFIDGEEKVLTESEVENLRSHGDEGIRKKAFESLFRKTEENSVILTNIYNSLAKDWDLDASKRHFSSPISMRNIENEVSDESVENLIDATTQGYSIVQDYYRLKARVMNKEILLHSDIYAPLADSRDIFSWQEAKNMILEVMGNFDSQSGRIISGFFDDEYIHGSIIPGKRSGAFCYYASPEVHPYVLVNFGGKTSDVLTLAHELGHGLHGVLSSKQTHLNYETPLTMAETASIFSEMLMTDFLLDNISGKAEKLSLISKRMEEILASTARQNMFTRFEMAAHSIISREFLSFKELSDLYFEELKLMFADTIVFFPESKFEWARIPHIFHTPFYCYAYNFAQLLVISLYRMYLEDGDVFKRRYIRLLESGSSDSPEILLKSVGIDISEPYFWENGLHFIQENFLERLRDIIDS